MSVVWECGSCGARSLERRCEECNLFCSKVGAGGECPACAELIAAAELEGLDDDHKGVALDALDVLDASELAEVLDYIAEWLADAPPEVIASLNGHGGGPGARELLLEALARQGRALAGAVGP